MYCIGKVQFVGNGVLHIIYSIHRAGFLVFKQLPRPTQHGRPLMVNAMNTGDGSTAKKAELSQR